MRPYHYRAVTIMLAVAVLVCTASAGSLGYLSIPCGGPVAGGGPVPVYADPDEVKRSIFLSDRESAAGCEALDNTPVEIFEEDRVEVEFRGVYVKVHVLEGDCKYNFSGNLRKEKKEVY
ncbi:MAG: hypothetical protein AB1805_07370 [Nitrospirota bacterium]